MFAGQASPVLEGINEEGSDAVPELLTIPPPPPRKVLPDPEALGPAPETPARPPSLNPSEFIPPPPVDDNGVNMLKTLRFHWQLCYTTLILSTNSPP